MQPPPSAKKRVQTNRSHTNITHQTPGSATPGPTPGYYASTPGSSFAGGGYVGSAFAGGGRAAVPASPAPTSPFGTPAPGYGYGSALGSMATGVASASATPAYRQDSAALFTGGAAAAVVRHNDEDALWITVYGFTEDSHEQVQRMICGHGIQVDFVRGQGNWFFMKFMTADDALRMLAFDGQIIDSGTQHCCMIGVRLGRHNFSVVDAVGKDRDPDASILFEQSADRNRLPAVSYTSTLTRQPAKGRAELHSGSKTPFWGLLKGFVADLMHVAGGKEP